MILSLPLLLIIYTIILIRLVKNHQPKLILQEYNYILENIFML
jgi:hypothetical protein